jgi:tRNA pseudouridine32 synthase/23S rRNA pseudouridine746 synthase
MVGAPAGKASRTHWRALAEQDGRTLVEFRPETGRTHQIRVHAASGLNMPVVGDPVYGRARRVAANQAGGQGMLLHAAELVVQRPGKEPIKAVAPLPERFGAWPVLAD